MKTVTCDRCGRTLRPNEVSKSLSAENFIDNLGSAASLVYYQYATYDLCEQCNTLFNHFIVNAISDFVHRRVNEDNEVIDNEERPQGEWIKLTGRLYKCNNCGDITDTKYSFCHCGAKMKMD